MKLVVRKYSLVHAKDRTMTREVSTRYELEMRAFSHGPFYPSDTVPKVTQKYFLMSSNFCVITRYCNAEDCNLMERMGLLLAPDDLVLTTLPSAPHIQQRNIEDADLRGRYTRLVSLTGCSLVANGLRRLWSKCPWSFRDCCEAFCLALLGGQATIPNISWTNIRTGDRHACRLTQVYHYPNLLPAR
jgi:hypothetical protein